MSGRVRVWGYVVLGVVLLVLLDPRTWSDESFAGGDEAGIILAAGFVVGLLEAAVVLTVVVLAVELTLRHRVRRGARPGATGGAGVGGRR